MKPAAAIDKVEAAAYRVPTDRPESDGTIEWDATTIVIVHVSGGGGRGLGYSYTSSGAAAVVHDELSKALAGTDAMDTGACWRALTASIRNLGDTGIARMAAAAVIAAVWDLKARLLEMPLVTLLGAFRPGIPVYGSGGFTSYTLDELAAQLGGWASEGIRMVKMKIGRDWKADPERIETARDAIGPDVELFVDANGAYDRKQALQMTEVLVPLGVTWYEQPINHLDFEGMRLLRDRAPAQLEIASGEYGFELSFFRRMLAEGVVDVLQADATRCGANCFLEAGALCAANYMPLSAHTSPALHLHLCCAAERGPPPGIFSRPCPDRGDALRRDAKAEKRGPLPGPLPARIGARI